MERLQIPETKRSPKIDFDPQSGILAMSGKSIPEYTDVFYNPIIEWISNYCDNTAAVTTFDLNFEYLNSSSKKFLLDMIKMVKAKDATLQVKWHHEKDMDDIMDEGTLLGRLCDIEFEMCPYEPEEEEDFEL